MTTASGPSRSPTTTRPSRSSVSPGADRGRARRPSGATRRCCRCRTPSPSTSGTGCTPLVRADRLAAELGLGELWIKNDTANPTGSFKDRVVSVALTKARQLGFKVAACASTGNLANSVAAHAARAGMVSVVFIPRDLEVAKVVTTAVYGGHVVAVDGTYDDVNRLCAELTSELPVLGVRQRQRPHVLRRGVQDPRLRGRRAARVGGSGPRHRAGRLGQPAHQGGQGLRRAPRRGPARRGAPRPGVGRPGRGVLAGGDGLRRGHRRHPAREAATPSPSPSPSATPPTAGTRSRRCARAAGPSQR